VRQHPAVHVGWASAGIRRRARRIQAGVSLVVILLMGAAVVLVLWLSSFDFNWIGG